MNKLFLLLILATQIQTLSAQNILLSVKKGTARINGKEWLPNYPPLKLYKVDKISTSEDAILLFQKGFSTTNMNGKYTNLSYNTISKKFASNTVKVSYIDVIFNIPIEAESESQKGGVSRGTGAELDTFSINLIDSAWIMNDEYFVHWKSDFPSKQIGSMKLSKKSNLSIPIMESEDATIPLKDLTPGWYQLDFSFEQTIGIKLLNYTYSYIFLIPSQEEKLQIQKDIEEITKELNEFENEELKSIILNEYMINRRLYGLID